MRNIRENLDDSTSSDDEYFQGTARHLGRVKAVKKKIHATSTKFSRETVQVVIDDVQVHVEADSGADVNIMDEHQYKAFVHRAGNEQKLLKSKVQLTALQNELPVKGEFNTVVRNNTRGVKTKIIVVHGRMNSPPILSKNTLQELGMLEIRSDGSLGEINHLRITDTKQISKKKTPVAEKPQLVYEPDRHKKDHLIPKRQYQIEQQTEQEKHPEQPEEQRERRTASKSASQRQPEYQTTKTSRTAQIQIHEETIIP